jgi:hypothetical protein
MRFVPALKPKPKIKSIKMKKDFLNKMKGSLLTREEAKTISGGYGLGGGTCNYAICTQVYYLNPSDPCQNDPYVSNNGWKTAYGMTASYNYPTTCLTH